MWGFAQTAPRAVLLDAEGAGSEEIGGLPTFSELATQYIESQPRTPRVAASGTQGRSL